MSTIINLCGQVFGRLTVIRRVYPKGLPAWKDKQAQWQCLCKCGNKIITAGRYLRDGDTKSCGCREKELLRIRNTVHGLSKLPEYGIWNGMKNRCYNENVYKYPDYGGRSIEVCERWKNSFVNFLNDMGRRPSKKHSLDRIKVNGNYTPSNCRWATPKQQAKNKRNNRWIVYKNKKKIFQDWAAFFKVNSSSLHEMVKKHPFDYVYNFYTSKNKKRA